MAGRRPRTSTARTHPVNRAGLVDLAARGDPRAAPQDPITRADRAARADRLVAPANGMGIHTVATSAGPRGETGPHRGGLVSPRRPPGANRCHLREASGSAARSTTGATRKHRCGTPDSTSGASGSSESGFRWDKQLTRFAGWRGERRAPHAGLRPRPRSRGLRRTPGRDWPPED